MLQPFPSFLDVSRSFAGRMRDETDAMCRGRRPRCRPRDRRRPAAHGVPVLPRHTRELLSRLGRNDEAVVEYERALELTHDDAERRLLERRLAELDRAGSATIRWVVGVVTPLTRWTLRDGGVRRGVDLLRRQQVDGFVETALSPTVLPSAGQ
jgi:hypothetical protein